eukprot:CAMPEP_0182482370 /NCGR_PEP_ID=MMETSP1319-20130603/39158_1 /TAXON_ID=172717 /ORGANISM="Bolidomonas pacifica, Strain RCC208" /LENGTH=76 /DNA_ID=CAMNT_0024684081 /DNA_START=74 /DNA_END=300 /DNA_ORIENTATION=-
MNDIPPTAPSQTSSNPSNSKSQEDAKRKSQAGHRSPPAPPTSRSSSRLGEVALSPLRTSPDPVVLGRGGGGVEGQG